MQKQKTFVECDCGLEIIGFSDKHAKGNLIIHKKASKKHKQLLKLKEKWLKKLKMKND